MVLYVKNANIRTMDKEQPRADAAVIIGEYFAYVGDEPGAEKFLDEHGYYEAEVLDGRGQLLLPGFNDSHMHYLHYIKRKQSVDLSGTTSIKDLILKMTEGYSALAATDESWLMGEGWNQDFFDDEKRFPTAMDLDQVSADVPIVVMRACFHIGVLNTKAMELLGINKSNVGQYGIFAEVNPDGTPNGVFKENVFDDIKVSLPAPGVNDLVRQMLDGQRDMFSCGITTVQSDDFKYVPEGEAYALMEKLRAASEDGRLKLRIAEQALLTEEKTLEEFYRRGLDDHYGNRRFKISGIKILSDGSLGARTAYLRKPYHDRPETKGLPLYSTQQELDTLVLLAHKHNMPAIIHAIGDGAVEICLNAISRAKREMPHLNPRHGIVHCQITDRQQLERFREMNVVAYVQPVFLDYDMHIVYDRVGKALAETSYAFGTMERTGVPLAFGTDCPVEACLPMPGLYCAVTRKDLRGNGPYLPHEAVSLEEALYAYTTGGAYATGEENIKGKIRAGMLADFALFDQDIFALPPEKWMDIRTTATYVGGECVYEA